MFPFNGKTKTQVIVRFIQRYLRRKISPKIKISVVSSANAFRNSKFFHFQDTVTSTASRNSLAVFGNVSFGQCCFIDFGAAAFVYTAENLIFSNLEFFENF